ncbi:MAG: hypothetical protein HPY58_09460 [Firmicutes bacterium]|nr:hypothetical protein [Bacillota bacterium]
MQRGRRWYRTRLTCQNAENRCPQLIISAAVLGLSLIICVVLATSTWARQRSTIRVTGAAATRPPWKRSLNPCFLL